MALKAFSKMVHYIVKRDGDESEEIMEVEELMVPDDVKEGHFAIVAVGKNPNEEEEELKPRQRRRFVVELSVLRHPEMLRLLELAEQEYGFQQKGALAVPCQPDELLTILQGVEAKSDYQ